MSIGLITIAEGPNGSTRQQSHDELTVHGMSIGNGSGPLTVDTEQIRGVAVTLTTVADRVEGHVDTLRRAAIAVAPHSSLTPSAATASQRCWQGIADGVSCVQILRDLAGRVQSAASDYEAAEAASLAGVLTFQDLVDNGWATQWWQRFGAGRSNLVLRYLVAEMDAYGLSAPTRRGAGLAVAELVHIAGPLVGFPGLPVGGAALGLAAILSQWNGLAHGTEVRLTQINAPGAGAPPGAGSATSSQAAISSIEDVAMAFEHLDGLGEHADSIRIDRVVDPDGNVGWLVVIPGSEGWLSGGALDWTNNPGAMVGIPDVGIEAVTQAMRAAGVGSQESVVLAGHSQGGLVAVGAANALEEEFAIAGVVSLGAPIGRLPVPQTAEVLSVEHLEDPVPGLDQAANPVAENLTTVERSLLASDDPAMQAVHGPFQSHSAVYYSDTGRLIDHSRDPAVGDSLEAMALVLNPDATATSSYYHARRER